MVREMRHLVPRRGDGRRRGKSPDEVSKLLSVQLRQELTFESTIKQVNAKAARESLNESSILRSKRLIFVR